MNLILINADDAGLHPDVDRGIQQCIDAGVVNSVSVIANSSFIEFDLIKQWNAQGIKTGVHLSWVGEKWLTKPYFFLGWKEFLPAFIFKGEKFRMEVFNEAKAQIDKMGGAGFSIAHLDSHQHVHHFPILWESVVELQREYQIPRIRCAKAIDYSFVRKNFAGLTLQFLAASKNSNDSLLCGGLKYSGNYSSQALLSELKAAAGKDVEFVVHPGTNNNELNKYFRHWNFDWEKETKALLSPEIRQWLEEH